MSWPRNHPPKSDGALFTISSDMWLVGAIRRLVQLGSTVPRSRRFEPLWRCSDGLENRQFCALRLF